MQKRSRGGSGAYKNTDDNDKDDHSSDASNNGTGRSPAVELDGGGAACLTERDGVEWRRSLQAMRMKQTVEEVAGLFDQANPVGDLLVVVVLDAMDI